VIVDADGREVDPRYIAGRLAGCAFAGVVSLAVWAAVVVALVALWRRILGA
jgi:hypothetical protein